MKKIIISAMAVMLVAATGHAQTIYEGVKFTDRDLNGTARFVGMGGAMGALGGDISTIGTNPAGIGIYRSNDFMTSFGFSAYGTEANYGGKKFNSDNTQWSFDNVGAVFSTKIGNYTSMRYVNFGFNYKRTKSLFGNMTMEGLLNFSQTVQMAHLADVNSDVVFEKYRGEVLDYGRSDIFSDDEAAWLPALGWNGGLLNQDDKGYVPIDARPDAYFKSQERGGIAQYDFNVAFNFSDRFYLGFTIGAYDVDYTKNTMYDEDFGTGAGYNLQSWNRIGGSGFDFKMGAIVRPFESLPLRLGFAIHTPTFYKLTFDTSARMEADMYYSADGKTTSIDPIASDKTVPKDIDTVDELNRDWMSREFKLQTPWKYNFSLGYTIGKALALGAEYEYQDYSTMRFIHQDGEELGFETETAEVLLKGVSTFRVGAEYKVIPQFAFRLGYNYTSTAYKDNAYKALPYNSINTDTDFANAKGKNDYTLGIGYRGEMFYADMAYKYTTFKSDFYAFDTVGLNKTSLTDTRSQVLFTLGMRF